MGMAQRALAAASALTATAATTATCVSLVHLSRLFQSITLRHRENPWSGERASHLVCRQVLTDPIHFVRLSDALLVPLAIR